MTEQSMTIVHSLLTEFDIELFRAGKHFRLYEKLGSHPLTLDGVEGTYFAVWAPGATKVSVIGDFNAWNNEANPLNVRWDSSGIWEGFIPGAAHGQRYKYAISSDHGKGYFEKGDPYARLWENPPNTASIIWDQEYEWKDASWMKERHQHNSLESPMTVYEMHAGSWRWNADEDRPLTWREMAEQLPPYIKELGFTHVEFMPVMEYPFDPSWGYQLVGYFAPTSRFGSPEDFKFLVDTLHKEGIGVILDWVPSHFPSDDHGLALFDGSAVYEHPDPRKGYHPDWKSMIFNYGRAEVRSFLISNALFWLDQFHADGLRVDAVASMLYLDYSREDGEWIPNEYGGRENLDAIQFMKDLNVAVYGNYPDVQTIAEESTAFPGVTRPVDQGGLGFGLKWMMGWMHDSLEYFSRDPIHRTHHHNEISQSLTYAFSENYMLPISHDEVVYGKKSMLDKMPGDSWQKRANLRVFWALMYGHPGSKLVFMGSEFGQWEEWNFGKSLDWHLTEYDDHKGIQRTLSRLNEIYRSNAALYGKAYDPEGYEWIDWNDNENSVISFIRTDKQGKAVVVVASLTPVVRERYRLGVPSNSTLKLLLNTDDKEFGGSGYEVAETFQSEETGWHGRPHSVLIDLPPLACLFFELEMNEE
ncbi:1,4-alpha-glucan branching protein GlgB [Sanyastnella coralliicola]|uniref:1,4-alpha-glucan branching protein GlgB n=1 Tax=Sanyastnella coralliicola TaxID=3069118 RepID=UPI0027B9497B|nr:1,4-alpha-glucan branching protein GlgB [Longitalea sp. SCSIO 12813]